MAERTIYEGRVVTMNGRSDVHDPGRVYVDGTTIVAVRPAAKPAPDGWDDARLVRTGDTIYPGLIELHNHLSYNALPLWQTPQRFTNRGQWMRHRDYRRFVSGPASVLGRTGGFLEAVVRYVEAKCLLGGVTTSQGIALASNMGIRRYYKGLVRNVEDTDDDALPAAATRVADVEAGSARAFLKTLNRSSSLLLHLAEGVDKPAREHFKSLRIGTDEWAITPSLCGIHCAGLTGRDYQIFRARGGSMVWSPLSNLLLYGGTADIERARAENLPVALGSDWSPSGSKNLLAEMKVAWLVSEARGGVFTPRELVAMATVNPARMLKWDAAVGSLEPGKRADMVVVDGRSGDPYEHLLKARESAITLVVVDGQPRYGQPSLMRPFTAGRTAEGRTVGGADRVLDLTDALGDPVVGALSLADAEARLAEGLRTLPELARVLENPDHGRRRPRRQRRHQPRRVVPRARPRRARRHERPPGVRGAGRVLATRRRRRTAGPGPVRGGRAAVRGARPAGPRPAHRRRRRDVHRPPGRRARPQPRGRRSDQGAGSPVPA